MNNNKIYGVALGPGDPDLITVKALKILEKADLIYYPSTVFKGKKSTFAGKILEAYNLDPNRLIAVEVEMSSNRDLATKQYGDACKKMISEYRSGKDVVFVAEGDISFFSTFAYFINDLKNDNIEFEMIPGVPAFIAAGAISNNPLVIQSQKLTVLPAPHSIEEVKTATDYAECVVIMKLSIFKNHLYQFLENFNGEFFYCEKVTTDDQFTTTELEEIKDCKIPYFSILILKRER